MQNKIYILGIWMAGSLVTLMATLYSPEYKEVKTPTAFLQSESRWADSLIQNMSVDAKINQMFIVVDSAKPETDSNLVEFVKNYHPGGILFHDYDVEKQFVQTRTLQTVSQVPLLMGLRTRSEDPRWVKLPGPLALGSIEDESLIKDLGGFLGEQGRNMGLHFLVNPPMAENYSAQNRERLLKRELILSKQILTQELLPVSTGAHVFYPQVYDSLKLKAFLSPYKKMAEAGMPAIILNAEQLSSIQTHFHKKGLIQEYLRKEINYQGLLLADLSDITDEDKSETYFRKALHVGTDLFILNRTQLMAANSIVQDMLNRTRIDQDDLDKRIKRSLLAKTWTQAERDHKKSFVEDSLEQNLSLITHVNQQVTSAKMTLLRDEGSLIPFRALRDKRIHLSMVGSEVPHFLKQLRSYGPVSHTDFDITDKNPWTALPIRTLKTYNPVILSLSGKHPDPGRDTAFISSVKQLAQKTDVILVNFSSVAALEDLPNLSHILQAYESDSLSQVQTAQVLFGGIAASGKFPLELEGYPMGSGLSTRKSRLRYTAPEAVGIDAKALTAIDSIVYEGLASYAMPGCQVMVVKSGNIIFNESYGYHTYARRRGVFSTDIYDLASVTKVAATTVAAMHVYEKGLLKPEHRLGRFFDDQTVIMDSIRVLDTLYVGLDSVMRQDTALLASLEPKVDSQSMFIKVWMGARPGPWIDTLYMGEDSVMLVKSEHAGKVKRRGSVFQAQIGEMLTHTSGLPAGLPIRHYTDYQNSRRKIGKYDKYFQPQGDSIYSIKVANGFYLRKDYLDSLWKDTKLMHLDPRKKYEYSDANMILLQQAIDSINHQPMDSFLNRVFYERLGMQNTAFKPRNKFDEDRLVPTEYDAKWRGQLLRGFVHDPTAALMGGVAGNAGLFANASDLAILFQMLLNGGTYGGETYFSPRTVSTFTRTQGAHRGYGFDKSPGGPYIIAESASPNTYGHTGFTGTCVWVDPDEELIFIFLSNRIHPKSNNWKLNQLRIRQRIHQAVYDALEKSAEVLF